MIYIIHKILELLKNHLNYFKHNIFKCFFMKYNKLFFFFKFITMKNPRCEEEKIINYIKNPIRLKQNYMTLQVKI